MKLGIILYIFFRAKNAPPRSPPSALKKRLERLNSLPDAKHPITVYKEGEITKLKSGLSKEDQEIADRLQNLKSPPKASELETEEEIRARLAKLKGTTEMVQKPSGTNKSAIYTKPSEADFIQQQKLLKQMSEQLELEKDMPNPDDELATRLAKLKGVDVETIKHPGKGLDKKPEQSDQSKGENFDLAPFLSTKDFKSSNTENIDEETLAKDIDSINKELSEMRKKRETKVKDGLGQSDTKDDSESSDDEEAKEEVLTQVIESLRLEDHDPDEEEEKEFKMEEYPWCIICNEDANLRCRECDGDLYCTRCFKECHKDYDIRDHTGESYKKPRAN